VLSLFLLACPLMMVFMMRGMAMNHAGNRHATTPDRPDAPERIAALAVEVTALRKQQSRTEDRDGAQPS